MPDGEQLDVRRLDILEQQFALLLRQKAVARLRRRRRHDLRRIVAVVPAQDCAEQFELRPDRAVALALAPALGRVVAALGLRDRLAELVAERGSICFHRDSKRALEAPLAILSCL
jgi:hypothetical protein